MLGARPIGSPRRMHASYRCRKIGSRSSVRGGGTSSMSVPLRGRKTQTVGMAPTDVTQSIARMEESVAGPAVRGTKGVHIAVPAGRVGNSGAVTMLSPDDGRVMFTLPAGAQTIIGTTDTPTTEHPHEVNATRADVRYLLSAANRFFPDAKLTDTDVIAAWAGIRPLVARTNTAATP